MDLSKSEKIAPISFLVIALTVLAPVLGGAAQLWWQAALSLSTGLLFLLFPPRKSLGLLPHLALAGLLALALAGFLPAHCFSIPPWRSELAGLGLPLPGTMSPQPWLTLEAVFSLLLGLSWAYYVLALDWSGEARRKAWTLIAATTVVLAGGLTVSYLLKQHIPFWPDVPEFGFFPNRNHSSNVLALGGVLIYAIGLQRLKEHRPTWWAWLACLALVCSALILNYSRAGIILFFGGTLAWHSYWLITSTDKRLAARTSAGLLFPIGILLLIGGATLARFGHESGQFFGTHDGRIAIYRDAFDLLLQSPITGIGLNNFGAIFATHQRFSVGPDVSIHPESDWMWSTIELGWLAPILIALLFCWWVSRCFPFEPGTFRLLRAAALICGCGFVLHAFFDVPGHHLAALWPALLLASTALHPRRPFPPSAAIPWLFRILALILIGAGGCWFASMQDARSFPTSVTLNRIRQNITRSIDRQEYEKALDLATEGLRISPLDWEFYFKRGFAEAVTYHPRAETSRDFAAAQYLLPNWPELYLKEGQVWLGLGEPDLAFAIWRRGMQMNAVLARELYEGIYPLVQSDAEGRDRWRELGESVHAYRMIFLRNSTPTEFALELDRIMADDPPLQSFTPEELNTLFQLWSQSGDKLTLITALQQHPAWQKIAWRHWARALADLQDYRQAYETVVQFSTPPALPGIDPSQIPPLAARFRVSRDLGHDGLPLAAAQYQSGAPDEALRTIEIASTDARAPRALHYLAAQIWASKGDWPKAWQAITKSERVFD